MCTTILFADDTNIFITGSNSSQLFNWMFVELDKYFNWFASNKFALNLTKSCYIVFGPKIKTNLNIFDELKISMGNDVLPRVDSTKFPCLII